MDKMIERLEKIDQREAYLEKMMALPSVAGDFSIYRQYAKEKSDLEKIAELYRKYKKALQTQEDCKLLLKDTDTTIVEMAKLELVEAENEAEKIYLQLKLSLIPKDPRDDKNVIVEIRGAAGGDEGNIFAGDLFRMYTRYAESQGWKIEMLDTNLSEMGGYSLVSFMVRGKSVYSQLKYESGAHRVQRVPRTESSGRIHTSTATVLVMPEADEIDVQVNNADLQVDTYRSGGAGGQHVNKTDSAVRITHLPTGIVVACQEGRSQIENREKAMAMLRTRIYDQMVQQAEEARGQERRSKIGTGDRSEKIRTYNYPQNRVTDHRIGFTLQRLNFIMEGDVGEVIEALINEDQKRKLEGGNL